MSNMDTIDYIRYGYMGSDSVAGHIAEYPYTIILDDTSHSKEDLEEWVAELYDRELCDFGYPSNGDSAPFVFWFAEKAKAVEFKLIFGGT